MKHTVLFFIAVALSSVACGPAPAPVGGAARGDGESGGARALLGEQLSLDEVDSMRFKPTGARVGLQSYASYNSPVVSFVIPRQSNFVEIVRCGENLKVVGTTDGVDIRNLDLGYGYDEQQAIFKRNDFWSAAIAAGCQRITTGLVDEIFFDTQAPDGNSFYLIRGCVFGERIEGVTSESEYVAPVCSRMIGTTAVLRYVNERATAQKQKLAEAQKIADEAFGLTRQAMSVAVKLENELATCQSEASARRQRTSILDWLQQGLGFAKQLFPLFNLPINVDQISSGLAMLKNVFGAKQPSLPPSCQFAIDLQSQGQVLAVEIEALQKQYVDFFAQVETAHTPNLEDAYYEQ